MIATSNKNEPKWPMFYKLVDGEPVPCGIDEFARSKKRLWRYEDCEVLVSTVFLGIEHGFHNGKPVLFETMVFGGKHNGYQDRYTSLTEAFEGHETVVNLVKLDKPFSWSVLWKLIKNFFADIAKRS